MENYCNGSSGKDYWDKDFWEDNGPGEKAVNSPDLFYSTNYYASRAVQIIETHLLDEPLWVHIPWQAVHAPYTDPPAWEQRLAGNFWDQTFASMLQVLDNGVANVTSALSKRGMW